MTSDAERWIRIRHLYQEASRRPEGERRAFVASACPDDQTLVDEVLALVATDLGRRSILDDGIDVVAESVLRAPRPISVDPDHFLPYRLLAPLGEGGMGVVFLAERADLEMRVAIKILRDAWLSPARRRRFIAEQRTLAQLHHAGIARIHDAHTLPDGTPWFVMEYVDGLPITEHCQRQQCTIDERLRMFRAVCEAVQYAHAHDVIHRDLKPSNILVSREGAVRLVDFGIAKRLDMAADGAASPRTTLVLMTPAYAAPEQLRGAEASRLSDVYSLGVVLYELLTGRLPHPPSERGQPPAERRVARPSTAAREAGSWDTTRPRRGSASWTDLDVLCLTAMHEDAGHRYQDVTALIADIDHCLDRSPLGARADSLAYATGRIVRRHWPTLASTVLLVTAGVIVSLVLTSRSPAVAAASAPSVAVLPFRNATGDSALGYLSQALPEEIATTLGSRRGLAVRPFASTSGYAGDTLKPSRVGAAIGVSHVVTGDFTRDGPNVLIRLRSVRVADDSVVWEDRLTLEPGNTIALQGQVANLADGSLVPRLGVAVAHRDLASSRPHNERAYELFLRSAGGRYDAGPGNAHAIAMLEEAVTLDSTYAPAWLLLGRRYYIASRFGLGGARTGDLSTTAARRAVALDPDLVLAGVRVAINLIESGETAEAYRSLQGLLRHRADSPDVHFALSYVLRFAGLLQESARECGVAMSIDAHNFGWRTCAVPYMQRGDDESAMGFLALDAGSEWYKAMRIHMLVREGRRDEALQVGRPNIPQWKSYDLLLACIAGGSVAQRDSLAALVQPSVDPESNYFAASHLAYCGRPAAAFALLEEAVRGGYCAYPVLDRDPFLVSLRVDPRFAPLRAEAMRCQARFLAAVARPSAERL